MVGNNKDTVMKLTRQFEKLLCSLRRGISKKEEKEALGIAGIFRFLLSPYPGHATLKLGHDVLGTCSKNG